MQNNLIPDMTDIVMTKKEKIDWVDKYKNLKCLYKPNVSNLFWVYEECNSKYLNCSNKDSLAKWSFSNHRLKHYVSWLHLLCPSNELQAYTVKSGIGCHYQVNIKSLFHFLYNDDSNIPIHIYGNLKNHETDFLTVWNNIPKNLDINEIDFESFEEYIDVYGNTNNSPISNVRQEVGMYADFGYTCGQSLSRKYNTDGVSRPNLKIGSKYLSYLFFIGTCIIDEMQPLF